MSERSEVKITVHGLKGGEPKTITEEDLRSIRANPNRPILFFKGIQDEEMSDRIIEAHNKALDDLVKKYGTKLTYWLEKNIIIELNDRMRSCGGRAYYKENKIRLNYRLHKENPEQLLETYIHELAHLVTNAVFNEGRSRRVSAHGREWASVMRVMGYEPERTHSMKTKHLKHKRRKYKYTCDCAGVNVHVVGIKVHNKIQNGSTYTCRSCNGPIKKK